MTITESLKFTLSKYVVFQGRASRREWVICAVDRKSVV